MSKKGKVLLIDADPVVYRCGFAAETHSYNLVWETAASTSQHIQRFEPSEEQSAGDLMKAWVKKMEDTDGFTILDKEKTVAAQPVANALEATKAQMESIISECGVKNVQTYLSRGTNYRYAIARQRPYKGNRTADKPVHYNAIREYLSQFWGAEVVDKIEADDKLSILARREDLRGRSIVATIDKDLDQIPGPHYNYMKKVFYDITDDEAELFFYQQCLSGDTTDNIPGCYKIGGVKAEKIVNDLYAAAKDYSEKFDWGIIWNGVEQQYKLSQEKAGCPYADQDYKAVALETARLVRLQEYDGQLWMPPGVPDEIVTEELYAKPV